MKLKLQDRPTAMQRRLLIAHMKETRYIEGKGKERKYQWAKITNELNGVGPPKTLAQWKKQWQNLRLSTRKKLQEISRRHPGSPIPELTEEDNEIIFIESTQPAETKDNATTSNDADMITNFKQENLSNNYPLDSSSAAAPSTSTAGQPIKQRKKYTRKIKPPPPDEDGDEQNISYIQPRTKASMEVNARAFRGLCEQAKKGRRKKKLMHSDELFMLSFVEDLKKIPEYRRLDVKTDIIAVFKKWSTKSQETQYDSNSNQNDDGPQDDISGYENNSQHGDTFDTNEKPFVPQRPISQLSHNSNSLGPLPLNLQQHHPHHHHQQQQQQHHHQQSSPLHSIPPLLPTVASLHQQQQQQQQQQHHHQQQQQQHQQQQLLLQHHTIPQLQNQHFPIYHRYGL